MDPRTGASRTLSTPGLDGATQSIAYMDGIVAVAPGNATPLVRVDAATGRQLATPRGHVLLNEVEAGVGDVWGYGDEHVVRLDPASGRVVASTNLANAAQMNGPVLAIGEGAVWAS